jgi:hypothetical protein
LSKQDKIAGTMRGRSKTVRNGKSRSGFKIFSRQQRKYEIHIISMHQHVCSESFIFIIEAEAKII